MTEPITAMTVAALAASKFMEGGVGKAGEKIVEELWNVIAEKFKGKQQNENVLRAVATRKNEVSIDSLAKCLANEMKFDPKFATQVKQLAQQIGNLHQTQQKNKLQQINNSNGRDMYVINNPTGNLRLGG
ncbi:MAG: hypothetical protein WA865_07015 [Spirulinaceae cyanobacterium]